MGDMHGERTPGYSSFLYMLSATETALGQTWEVAAHCSSPTWAGTQLLELSLSRVRTNRSLDSRAELGLKPRYPNVRRRHRNQQPNR